MTIAILSWGATKTLLNSLESYKKHGLDTLDNDKVIFFQEYSKEDRQIAKDYGWESFGSPENIGIAEAYKLLVSYASGDLFLFLENDWELIEDPYEQLRIAAEMLEQDIVDVVRFRHRTNPGHPLWSLGFKGNEYAHPTHLLEASHWTDPTQFSTGVWTEEEYPDWYFAFAKNANWTNNPTMFRTDWLRENILPRIVGNIEAHLQGWWQEQWFTVAQGPGLFTHNRLDR